MAIVLHKHRHFALILAGLFIVSWCNADVPTETQTKSSDIDLLSPHFAQPVASATFPADWNAPNAANKAFDKDKKPEKNPKAKRAPPKKELYLKLPENLDLTSDASLPMQKKHLPDLFASKKEKIVSVDGKLLIEDNLSDKKINPDVKNDLRDSLRELIGGAEITINIKTN